MLKSSDFFWNVLWLVAEFLDLAPAGSFQHGEGELKFIFDRLKNDSFQVDIDFIVSVLLQDWMSKC